MEWHPAARSCANLGNGILPFNSQDEDERDVDVFLCVFFIHSKTSSCSSLPVSVALLGAVAAL